MTIKVYVAAPMTTASEVHLMVSALKHDGFIVTAKWFNEAGVVEKNDPQWRTDTLMTNMADLDFADIVFAYMSEGSVPRCTLVEVGWALAKGKGVLWYGQRNVADGHPNVHILGHLRNLHQSLRVMGGCQCSLV